MELDEGASITAAAISQSTREKKEGRYSLAN